MNKPQIAYLLFCLLFCWTGLTIFPFQLQAQQFEFATLQGSPTMDTTGWNLAGDANITDTPGDANTDPDEMLLCPAVGNTSGACFYDQPIDISVCNRWKAEFDYRIYDGSGADGIAFCFLKNPPTGYILGGGVGIPPKPEGLMVVLDQYDNGCGTNPELQLFYGDGTSDYDECGVDVRQTNVGVVRTSNYNSCTITYDNGQIDVSINGTQLISGFYTTNYTGFLGFTSSTGGSDDNHSIKNVTIYTSKPPSDAGPDRSICSGDSVQIGTSPRSNFTYTWSPTTGLSDPTAANPKVSLTNNSGSPIQQEYVVTTDSANIGCTSQDTMTLTVNPLPSAEAGDDTTICSGGTATLQASGGNAYSWSHGANGPATQVSPSSTTTYTVTVTTQNNCQDVDNVTVNVNSPITALLTTSSYNGGYEISCQGASDGNINLNVNGGTTPYTFSWNNGQYQTKDLNNIPAGTYEVTITDAIGCTQEADTVLTEPPPLSQSVTVPEYIGGYNVSCNGASDGSVDLTVNGGVMPYSYSWNGGTYSSEDLANIQAGSYSVTVTDQNGCTITNDTTLTEPPPLTSSLSVSSYAGDDNISCNGASDGSIEINVNGGTPGYDYNWSNGDTMQDLDSMSAGQYSVTVTDSTGCSATFDTVLTEPDSITSILSPSTYEGGYHISCTNAKDGSIDLEIEGGTSPYNYSWNNGTYTTQDIDNLTEGKYLVSMTDANNCTHLDSITLDAPPPLSTQIQTRDVTCFEGNDGKASASVNGGVSPYSFTWEDGSTDSVLTGLSQGQYQVTVQDANNCQLTEPLSISQPPELSVNLPEADTIQFGDSTQIEPDYFANGNKVSFTWQNASDLSCVECQNPVASPLRTTSYEVTMTDEKGCTQTSSTKIVVLQDKNLFIPNAFTPDGNNLNDRFKIKTKGLKKGLLQVYNRWGELVFQTTNVLEGWDGTANGRKAKAGVYVYVVRLNYLDGTKIKRKGSVTLLR